MGAYAHLWLDDLLVGTGKNDISPLFMSLFRERDKVILSAPFGVLPRQLEEYADSLEEDPTLSLVYYRAPLSEIRDRMDVLGYSLPTAIEAFNLWIRSELEENQQNEIEAPSGRGSQSIIRDHYRQTIEVLSKLSPELWTENLNIIRQSGLRTNYYGRYEGSHNDPIIAYMLSNEWYGFPGYDLFVPLRLAIEAFSDCEYLVYDLTDLIWSEYFEAEEDFVSYGIGIPADESSASAKTIVLTEGRSDAWIIEESLELLFPHLAGYFSVLDFESTGYGGGVGNLANVVKALAGAGIVNNILALFDNDTASESALRGLSIERLPGNISIQKLPELEFLQAYPTIGPSGQTVMDVNGVAASIELYLGEDVLAAPDGQLTPVVWTGYDRSLKKYQGEVSDKSSIQDRFRQKLRTGPSPSDPSWDHLRAVLRVLFEAFEARNREIICRRPVEGFE